MCRAAGSRWALQQAKFNLVNEYLLVGVTEELEDFVMILEAALPRFFRGATELYRTGGNPELSRRAGGGSRRGGKGVAGCPHTQRWKTVRV